MGCNLVELSIFIAIKFLIMSYSLIEMAKTTENKGKRMRLILIIVVLVVFTVFTPMSFAQDDHNQVWVTVWEGRSLDTPENTLYRIDAGSGYFEELTPILDVNTVLGWMPDNVHLIFESDMSIFQVNTLTTEVTQMSELDGRVRRGMAIDDTFMVIETINSGTIYVLDTAQGELITIASETGSTNYVGYLGNSEEIIYSVFSRDADDNAIFDFYLYSLVSGESISFAMDRPGSGLLISPMHVYFSSAIDGDSYVLYQADSSLQNWQPIFRSSETQNILSFSPSGDWIVLVCCYRGSVGEMTLINSQNGEIIALGTAVITTNTDFFTPDEMFFFFNSPSDEDYIIDLSTKTQIEIPDNFGPATLTPDQQRYITQGRSDHLYEVGFDMTSVREIMEMPYEILSYHGYSSDSRQLYAFVRTDGGQGILEVDLGAESAELLYESEILIDIVGVVSNPN